jgi:hypothetical protein
MGVTARMMISSSGLADPLPGLRQIKRTGPFLDGILSADVSFRTGIRALGLDCRLPRVWALVFHSCSKRRKPLWQTFAKMSIPV